MVESAAESNRAGSMPNRLRFQQLLGLSAFSIAGPLLTTLGDEGAFFVAHGLRALEVLVLMVALLLLPGLALFVLSLIASLVHRRAGEQIQLLLVCLLVALTSLSIGVSVLPESDVIVPALALATGIGGGLLCVRSPRFASHLGILAVVPFLFGIFFISRPDIRDLVVSELKADEATLSMTGARTRGAVVVVVFDELPLTSLLGVGGELDRVRYPGFARLADVATWVRGASTVSASTPVAIPAILTGRYPSIPPKLATLAQQPENLFSLLAPSHALNVIEAYTLMSPEVVDKSRVSSLDEHPGRACLFEDLALVYAHLVTPGSVRKSLPPISSDWSCFARTPALASTGSTSGTDGTVDPRRGKILQQIQETQELRPPKFRRFLRSIASLHEQREPDLGELHFIHSVLPHAPWRYGVTGLPYGDERVVGVESGRWADEPWWTIEAAQRHLLQVGLTDRLLAALLDTLEETGIFDEALLVVTSDHGTSFWPGEKRRNVVGSEHPEDVLSVPLFIKRPGQREGDRLMRTAETIDILPTIADVLGVPLSPHVDGCSLFADDCPERTSRRVLTGTEENTLELLTFPPDIVYRTDSLERQLRTFGSGRRWPAMYGFGGRWSGLLGQATAELPVDATPGGTITLSKQSRRGPRIKGSLALARPCGATPEIAIARRGRIETVVPAPIGKGGRPLVLAMLPGDSVAGAHGAPDFYLICETSPAQGAAARLVRLVAVY